jgi:chorismate mutase
MKADLEKIAAALEKLESLNNSSNQQPAKSQPSVNNVVQEEKSSDNSAPHAIPPISVQQSQRKTPTLPAFNSPSISDRLPSQEPAIPITEPLKAPDDSKDPVLLLAQEQEIVQQIQELYQEGPIVDGYLESYYPSGSKQDLIVYDARQQSVEYVEAVGSSIGKVTCQAPRSAYRLCGVHPSGQKWAYPCPLEQLASVSMAIARYEKLVQLLERRQAIITRLSEVAKS